MDSEAGSSKSEPEETNDWVYCLWNKAYDKGYTSGRNYEALMHSGLELSVNEVHALRRFALSVGYISEEKHEVFLRMLKRLEDHV